MWSQQWHFKLRMCSSVGCGQQTRAFPTSFGPQALPLSPHAHEGNTAVPNGQGSSREKKGLKPRQSSVWICIDRSTGDAAGKELKQSLWFLLLCFPVRPFPSRYLNGHSKDSYQRQETELTSCSTKECKIWTFQTPVPPHWAQQLWTPGSRWTNGTVREHHICTTSFQLHHVWNKCEGMDNPHLEYWWEHSNSNRKQINNHICVIGRNFSSKLSLRKMWRG